MLRTTGVRGVTSWSRQSLGCGLGAQLGIHWGPSPGRAESQHVNHSSKMDERLPWRSRRDSIQTTAAGRSALIEEFWVPLPRTAHSGKDVRGGEPQNRDHGFYLKPGETQAVPRASPLHGIQRFLKAQTGLTVQFKVFSPEAPVTS